MKVTQILMHGRSVQGIQACRKTQTRRLSGLDEINAEPGKWTLSSVGRLNCPGHHGHGRFGAAFRPKDHPDMGFWMPCPYGGPGDLVYVREAWAPFIRGDGADGYAALLRFAADGYELPVPNEHIEWWERKCDRGYDWRPSIHMPRWASRITLRLTDVRVERVQEITADDCVAEGCEVRTDSPLTTGPRRQEVLRARFITLWKMTNGHSAWDHNDWVWVLCFEVIRANVDDVLADPARYGIPVAA